MIKLVGVLYNGEGFDPDGIAGNTLVTLSTAQSVTGTKTFGTVNATTVEASKVKATTDLVAPTSAPVSPENGSICKTAS